MEKPDSVDHAEILINACLTASAIAEIAASLKREIDYFPQDYDQRLLDAYAILKDFIRDKSGIGIDVPDEAVDAAIKTWEMPDLDD